MDVVMGILHSINIVIVNIKGENILRIRLCQMVISSYTQIWKLRHAY